MTELPGDGDLDGLHSPHVSFRLAAFMWRDFFADSDFQFAARDPISGVPPLPVDLWHQTSCGASSNARSSTHS
jgi:hypothetical protein